LHDKSKLSYVSGDGPLDDTPTCEAAMKKLKLNVDELSVESFEPVDQNDQRGTAHGYASTKCGLLDTCYASCMDPASCAATCTICPSYQATCDPTYEGDDC
jgi:hypothetical protein